MFFISGKFVAVFEPAIKLNVSENIVFANFSTSSKSTDNDGNVTYQNMYWKGRFVGEAFEPAKALRNGDKIHIIKGAIVNRYDTEKKKAYYDVLVFEFEMSEANSDVVEGSADSEEAM